MSQLCGTGIKGADPKLGHSAEPPKTDPRKVRSVFRWVLRILVALVLAAVALSSARFVVDELGTDDEDEDEVSNPAISDWYSYNFVTHTVHAKDSTYLVRVGGDRDALVHFDSYYCQDESAACITFRYRLVGAGDGADQDRFSGSGRYCRSFR